VCVCLAVSGYDVQTLNIPTVDQYLSHYAQLTSSDCVHNWSFYVAFVMFRTAAIAQGVYKRFTLGTTPFLPPLSLSLSLSLSVFVCLSVCLCVCLSVCLSVFVCVWGVCCLLLIVCILYTRCSMWTCQRTQTSRKTNQEMTMLFWTCLCGMLMLTDLSETEEL